MTTSEYKTRQAEIESQMKTAGTASDEYETLLNESNRLHAERQAELKRERKALKEQMKALKTRLEEIEEQIW
jgi:hypothetical protein